jgi:hypothetical protein
VLHKNAATSENNFATVLASSKLTLLANSKLPVANSKPVLTSSNKPLLNGTIEFATQCDTQKYYCI